jgi:cytochrome c-type biogenesis protein CcmH/NrfF
MRRALALAAAFAALAAAAAPATAATPRTTLGDVEDEVMCPVCGTPLNVAESPQANRERAYIRTLIAQGKTKAEIKRALVAQFGSGVLSLPDSGEGVNWAVYAVPAVLVLAALGSLALLVPRWRRRSTVSAGDGAAAPPPKLSGEDEQRVERELARLD